MAGRLLEYGFRIRFSDGHDGVPWMAASGGQNAEMRGAWGEKIRYAKFAISSYSAKRNNRSAWCRTSRFCWPS